VTNVQTVNGILIVMQITLTMPPRAPKRPCDCHICNDKLVEEYVWRAHQSTKFSTPVAPSSTLSTQSPPVNESMPLGDALPSSEVFADYLSPRYAGESLLDEKEAKRESSKYTQQAAARLRSVLKDLGILLLKLPEVGSHDEFDQCTQQLRIIRSRYDMITRRTVRLDEIRNEIQHRLGLVKQGLVDRRGKIGGRSSSVSVSYGMCLNPYKTSPPHVMT
jgi:hypothetical protein